MKRCKYIAVCLSRPGDDGEAENFRVRGKRGKTVFSTRAEVNAAVKADMAEYLEAETEAGFKASIVGNHIEWDGDELGCQPGREAKWYIYEIPV